MKNPATQVSAVVPEDICEIIETQIADLSELASAFRLLDAATLQDLRVEQLELDAFETIQ